jgi:hypothetical protein
MQACERPSRFTAGGAFFVVPFGDRLAVKDAGTPPKRQFEPGSRTNLPPFAIEPSQFAGATSSFSG